MSLFTKIIIDSPINSCFFYSLPDKLKNKAKEGHFVKIPFRNTYKIGCIVGFSETIDFDISKVRSIKEIINPEIIVTKELLQLTEWLSNYYFCSWGEALFASTPAILRKKKHKTYKSCNHK